MEFFAVKKMTEARKCGFMFLAGLMFVSLFSPQALSANRLLDIKYHAVIDHQLEIEFQFADNISMPKTDVDAAPVQLKLVFPDSHSELKKNQLMIDKIGVNGLSTQQDGTNLQIAIAMDKVLPYQGKVIGNRYRLTINDAISRPSVKQPQQSFVNNVKKIDFKRSPTDGGELDIELANSSIAVNVEQVGAKLELKFFNTKITDEQLYIVDVQDFATQVSSFETFREDLTTRVLVDVNGDYTYHYNQEGNVFKLYVDKAEAAAVEQKEKSYTGRTLSLNFQNMSVRTVLQIIADYNNFNLIVSDTVEGNITLRLDDVPWDQALDLILETKGLGKKIQGNILMVAPAEELAIRENQHLKNKQEIEKLAPLYSEYIQVNYAKAGDIADLLKNKDSSLLSKRGSAAVDERTNTLLIKDTAETIDNVHRLVKILDIPIRQVLIESRVVTVKDDVAKDLGVRWGFTDQQGNDGTSGSLEGANSIANGTTPNLADRLNVNLPVGSTNAAKIAFHVAKLGDGTLLDLELSALEQENKGEIVASPRLMTSNQRAAYIEQGVQIPYVEASSSGATTVTFKKAVLSLRVTPQITPDNRVILDLEITQDTQGTTVATPTGNAVAIDTQRIGTQVLVKNGETVVLGGIYTQNQIHNVSKVPILGDVPVLGYLFRSSQNKNERQELLIFVTPKIVTQQL